MGACEIVDHSVLIWNLLLLMCVGILPFTDRADGRLPEGAARARPWLPPLYSGSFLVMTLVFAATNHHVLFRRAELLADDVDELTRRLTFKRGVLGALPYLVATLLAFVSPYLTFVICASVAIFYALPFATASDSPSSATV